MEREKSPPGSPMAVERTMQKAQKQVNKETSSDKGRRQSEEEKPQRTLLTADDGKNTALLPVVSEENMDASDRAASSGSTAHVNGDASEDPEKDVSPPPNERNERRNEGIRMVSASTKRDSNEERRDDSIEIDDQDAYRDRDRELRREMPPRLDSTLLPRISPIQETEDSFGSLGNERFKGDPEKR
jgi:hypothetical protein